MAAGEFKVDLGNCSIGDQGCKYLVSGLHKYRDTDSAVTTLLTMNISMNAIIHHGVHHLSTLLKVGCIEGLNLSNDETFITSTFYNNTNCNKLGSLQGILYCSAYQPLLNLIIKVKLDHALMQSKPRLKKTGSDYLGVCASENSDASASENSGIGMVCVYQRIPVLAWCVCIRKLSDWY